jgi:hypothetical protein
VQLVKLIEQLEPLGKFKASGGLGQLESLGQSGELEEPPEVPDELLEELEEPSKLLEEFPGSFNPPSPPPQKIHSCNMPVGSILLMGSLPAKA